MNKLLEDLEEQFPPKSRRRHAGALSLRDLKILIFKAEGLPALNERDFGRKRERE